jgi:hypothetical protein
MQLPDSDPFQLQKKLGPSALRHHHSLLLGEVHSLEGGPSGRVTENES